MGSRGWAAIFDFDGVVVDTEAYHERCWLQLAKERGQSMTHEQYLLGFGVKNARFIAEILQWTRDPEEIERISKRKELLFQQIAATVPLVPGVKIFLEKLNQAKIPCAIASSSILKNIEILLDARSIRHYFTAIVSGEDVKAGKPDPEVFLCAASRLQTAPERSIVFEDALYGIEAAKRAGCRMVAITTTFPKARFDAMGVAIDKMAPNFESISVEEFDQWFT